MCVKGVLQIKMCVKGVLLVKCVSKGVLQVINVNQRCVVGKIVTKSVTGKMCYR